MGRPTYFHPLPNKKGFTLVSIPTIKKQLSPEISVNNFEIFFFLFYPKGNDANPR